MKPGIRWGDYDEMEDEIVIDQKDQDNPDVWYEARVSYHLNEKGQKVKRTETVRMERIVTMEPREVVERRKRMCANKFGAAATCDPKENLAMIDEETVVILKTRGSGLTNKPKTEAEKPLKTLADFRERFIEDMIKCGYSANCANKTFEQYIRDHPELTVGTTQGQVGIACRTCGGPHWTGRCPNKDQSPDTNGPGTTSGPSGTGGTSGDANSGKYRPPARDGRGGDSDHEYKIRINNLTEEATEQDLYDLVEPIGPVARVHIIKDRDTGVSRGFAFVTFRDKETAAKAIYELNGHPYYHLILQVETAKPRET